MSSKKMNAIIKSAKNDGFVKSLNSMSFRPARHQLRFRRWQAGRSEKSYQYNMLKIQDFSLQSK